MRQLLADVLVPNYVCYQLEKKLLVIYVYEFSIKKCTYITTYFFMHRE